MSRFDWTIWRKHRFRHNNRLPFTHFNLAWSAKRNLWSFRFCVRLHFFPQMVERFLHGISTKTGQQETQCRHFVYMYDVQVKVCIANVRAVPKIAHTNVAYVTAVYHFIIITNTITPIVSYVELQFGAYRHCDLWFVICDCVGYIVYVFVQVRTADNEQYTSQKCQPTIHTFVTCRSDKCYNACPFAGGAEVIHLLSKIYRELFTFHK